ncbi:RNA polymerase sigma factor [Caulobacter sp.]|uniref:RNA polymerase sigma factor n=1 Tax=Caulobacter sp. TaxID=78 RepID=UPI001B0EF681|nr:RNA polymerase sigma factor [Caulobacter sp.]MBO9547116.1 RNA polymerase sigma factor [Caulobacter sp.]
MSLDAADPIGREADDPALAARRQLEILFRQKAPALVRFLRRRTGQEEAQDLAQEAFLRLTRAADSRVLQKPEAYLARIARNLLRDRAKSVSGYHERTHAALEPELYAANDGDPHLALEARQLLDRLEQAMMRLPAKTREVYLRHRIDDQPYAEIARDLGIGVSAVEKHMMKAIALVDRHRKRS